MKAFSYVAAILFSLFITPSYAEDSPKESCLNAAELYDDDDLTGAIEEAQWCLELLKQEQASRVTSIFPDKINGYIGSELENQSAMGFSSSNRDYSKDNKNISVSLTSSSGGMMDAFSSIAQLGMGVGSGTKMRIQKRTATFMPDGRSMQIMVTLKSGGMLIFESRNVTKEEIIAFAKAFPIAELDDSKS